jgi:fumarate reductase flavoprotein subunit
MTARTAPLVVLLLAVSFPAAFSQPTRPFTADRHRARGLECASCHGGGEKKPVGGAQCLTCHESIEEVAKKTADIEPNPHDNHETVGGLDCTDCHKGHKQDVVLCRQCHTAMKFERKGNALHP